LARIIRIFYFLILFSLSNPAFSQIVVSGKILDHSNEVIPGGSVTLFETATNKMVAFGITDGSGRYQIKHTTGSDSLTIKVQMMGYGSQSKKIPSKSGEFNFTLKEETVILKEVKIRPDPITRHGDTLNYDVSTFKNQSDRTISDVIRKLPGIEIEPGGRILYQGNPINKYYIEGLDLLEGKYSLANENLSVDAVSKVQILENHQPIRVLDSLVFSENAALNIRLKSKVTATGTAQLAAGFSPLLWDAKLTPMLFTKTNQLIATYQANNTGNDAGTQLRSLTYVNGANRFENQPNITSWVQTVPLSPPDFPESRWLNNNIHLGSINYLKRIKKDFDLRINASYMNDYQKQFGKTRTVYFTPSDTISLSEKKYNRLFLNQLETNISLNKNTKRSFFKNQFVIRSSWEKSQGFIHRTGDSLSQYGRTPSFDIRNSLNDIFKIGSQLVSFNSFVSVSRTPQSLTVAPGQFEEILNGGSHYQQIRQSASQNTFYTHNALSLTKSIRFFTLLPQVGFQVENQKLETDLIPISEGSEQKLPEMYTNHTDWQRIKYYTNLKTQFSKTSWRIELDAPFSYNLFHVTDGNLYRKRGLKKLISEPRLSIKYDFNSYLSATGSLSLRHQFGEIDNSYFGYILKNYRTLLRQDAPLIHNQTVAINPGFNYRNPLSGVFANVYYSHTVTHQNLMYETRISPEGATELHAFENKNTVLTHAISSQFSKYISSLKTNINLGAGINFNSRNQLLNGTAIEAKNFSFTPTFRITSNFTDWVDIEYHYKLFSLHNQLADLKKQKSIQHRHQIKLGVYTFKQGYVGLQNSLFSNNFGSNTATPNIFTDLTFRYTLKKKKVDIEAFWNNVFNTASLATISVSSFTYIESVYQLRPSQLLLKVKFSY
jgi:hypothetical protein